jgi:sulfotransferase family protein
MITIDDVVLHPAASASGFHVGLDAPTGGTSAAGHLLRVAGWAATTGAPVRRCVVYAGLSSFDLGHGSRRRDDVVQALSWAAPDCGFDTLLLAAGLPTRFELVLAAATDEQPRVDLATIRGRRTALPAPDGSGPDPVLVTSLGRSGSSWLMRLLVTHPEIVGDPAWPHELSATGLELRTLRRLAETPHGVDAPSSFDFPEGGSWWQSSYALDAPGVRDWLASGRVELLAQGARAGVRGVHTAIAEVQGRPRPALFAEKAVPGAQARLVRELFPLARELVLVRDFRDVLASMYAFDAKRGYAGFGRDQVASEAAFVRRIAALADALHAVTVERPDAVVVRYEELVASPVEVLASVFSSLGVDPGVAARVVTGAGGTDEGAAHMTSATAASSVGRWRRDLPAGIADAAEAELGAALAGFGY